MTKVEEIERDIELLPSQEYEKLRVWFSEKDWKMWDARIEADSSAGKLDFLIKEAQDSRLYGSTREL